MLHVVVQTETTDTLTVAFVQSAGDVSELVFQDTHYGNRRDRLSGKSSKRTFKEIQTIGEYPQNATIWMESPLRCHSMVAWAAMHS